MTSFFFACFSVGFPGGVGVDDETTTEMVVVVVVDG